MKRVQLSTALTCAETGIKINKGSVCYQDTETKKVYSLCTDKVREWLSKTEDGSIIPGEDPVPDIFA